MKPGKQTAAISATLASLLIAGGCANTPVPDAERTAGSPCTAQVLLARYVATGSFTSAPDRNGRATTAYMQGYFVFDGEGGLRVERGLSSGHGNRIAWEGEGDYSIRSDCSGSMQLSTRIAEDREVTMELNFLLRQAPDEWVIESIFVADPGKTSGQLTLRQARP